MNTYSVMVTRHPKSKQGWLVVLQWMVDDPRTNGPKTGDRFARRYHYHRDAVECAEQAIRDLDQCPEFLPYDQVVASGGPRAPRPE